MKERNLSHDDTEGSLETALKKIHTKIIERKDLPYASVDQQLGILDLISKSELGCFLIQRGGLNGYWTQYVIDYPQRTRSENPIEDFLLAKSPFALAMRQRFALFQQEIQKHVKEGVKMASIPSGLMLELLDLDFSGISDFQLFGFDIDEETLSQAKEQADKRKLSDHCSFAQKDAWNLEISEEFDLLVSHGLSIYEPDDEKVTSLYREFFKALKKGGALVTSFMTPPPVFEEHGWNLEKINLEDAMMQKLILSDILESKWESFRMEKIAIEQASQAGFVDIEVKHDEASVFPTLIAKKP